MLQLSPMNQAEFEPYCEDAIASYADKNVKAGIWDAVSALSNAQRLYRAAGYEVSGYRMQKRLLARN